MSDPNGLSVLFITQYFPPETGAAPTRVRELTSRWAAAGHDVTVLTSAPDYPEGELYEGYENSWLHEETVDEVDVRHTKTIPASNEGFGRRALKFVWFMLAAIVVGLQMPRHDVVVATSPQPLTGVAAWAVSQIKGSRFVFEVRDLWPESISSLSGISEAVLYPLSVTIQFLYRSADYIVVVTKGFTDDIVEAGVDETNVLFHPNGVTPEFFEQNEGWSVSEKLISDLKDRFIVSYIGTIGRAHGLSVVIDAAEKLEDSGDDVLFLLVGTGAEAEQLEQEARRRNLTSVRFLGRRPKDEVPDLLALSDLALVHLRDIELFRTALPSKMFEAMASGTPILLGVRGEAEQLVYKADAGVVFEPEDSAALTDAIRTLQANDERRAEMSESARRYVREHFTWDQIARSYLDDLRALV